MSSPRSRPKVVPPGAVSADGERRSGFNRGLAVLVAGAFFMEILDGTVIAPAAPAIAADLGVAAVDINVAITAYLLTLAVLIPISGWMATVSAPAGCSWRRSRSSRWPPPAARRPPACRC